MEPMSYLKYISSDKSLLSSNYGEDAKKLKTLVDESLTAPMNIEIEHNSEDVLKNSPLNEIIPIENFNDLIHFLKKEKTEEWYKEKSENLPFFINMLGISSELVKEIFTRTDESQIDFYITSLFLEIFYLQIHADRVMDLYGLLNSYAHLAKNGGLTMDKGVLLSTTWDTIVIPISIRQPHLLMIKLLEIWFGTGKTYEQLDKRLRRLQSQSSSSLS